MQFKFEYKKVELKCNERQRNQNLFLIIIIKKQSRQKLNVGLTKPSLKFLQFLKKKILERTIERKTKQQKCKAKASGALSL